MQSCRTAAGNPLRTGHEKQAEYWGTVAYHSLHDSGEDCGQNRRVVRAIQSKGRPNIERRGARSAPLSFVARELLPPRIGPDSQCRVHGSDVPLREMRVFA